MSPSGSLGNTNYLGEKNVIREKNVIGVEGRRTWEEEEDKKEEEEEKKRRKNRGASPLFFLRRPRHLWDVDVVSDTDGHMYLTPTILAI